MDESFQMLMPLEQNAAVFPIAYPGSSVPMGTPGTSGDFLELLMSQLSTMFGTNSQDDLTALLPFDMPPVVNTTSLTGSTDGMATAATTTPVTGTQVTTVDLMNATLPFVPLPETALLTADTNGTAQEQTAALEQVLANALNSLTGQVLVTTQAGESGLTLASNTGTGMTAAMPDTATPSFSMNTMQFIASDGVEQAMVPQETLTPEQTLAQLLTGRQPLPVQTAVTNTGTLPSSVTSATVEQQMLMTGGQVTDKGALAGKTSLPAPFTVIVDQMSDMVVTQQPASGDVPLVVPSKLAPYTEKALLAAQSSSPLTVEHLSTFDADVADVDMTPLSETASSTAQHNTSNSFTTAQGDSLFQSATGGEAARFESLMGDRIKQAQDAQSIAQQIVRSTILREGATYSEFNLKLEPDSLGELRISVTLSGEVMSARITSNNAYTHDALMQNMNVLKEAFDKAGIQCDDITVVMNDADAGFDAFVDQNGMTGNEAGTHEPYTETPDEFVVEEYPATEEQPPSVREGTNRVDVLV